MPKTPPLDQSYLDAIPTSEIPAYLSKVRTNKNIRPITATYLLLRHLRESKLSHTQDAVKTTPVRTVRKHQRETFERLQAIFSIQELLDLERHMSGRYRNLDAIRLKLMLTSDKEEIVEWLQSPPTPEDKEELESAKLLLEKAQIINDKSKTLWSSLTKEWHTRQRTVAKTFYVIRQKYGIASDVGVYDVLSALFVVIRDYPYGRRRGKLAELCEEYRIDASAIDRDLFSAEVPFDPHRTAILQAQADDTDPLTLTFTYSEMRFVRFCLRRLARSQGKFIGVTTTYRELLLSLIVEWQEQRDKEDLGES